MTAARVAEIVQRHGELVTVRRLNPATTVAVRARLIGYEPSEIAGSIIQGDRRCFIGTQDLIAAGFPLPMIKNDKIVLASGKVLNVEGVDHRKWDDDEALTVLQVRG
jgi:hypothetical protein